MSDPAKRGAPTAPYYASGQWEDGPDVVSSAWGEEEERGAVMARLGYVEALTVGSPESVPSITVFERTETPRFTLSMETNGFVHNIYTDAVPDLWDLLARWSPVVRDARIAIAIEQASDSEKGHNGLIETIARRATWGATRPYHDPNRRR